MIKFDDKTMELYRQYYYKEDLKYFLIVVIIGMMFIVLFSIRDLAVFGPCNIIFVLRIVIGTAFGVALVLFWKNRLTSKQWDIFATAVATVIVLCNNVVTTIRMEDYPNGALEQTLFVKLIYIFNYLLVPIENLWLRAIPMALGGLIIIGELLYPVISSGTYGTIFAQSASMNFLTIFCMVNLVAIFLAVKISVQRRMIFSQYLQLTRNVELEKQLMEAERLNTQYATEMRLLSAQIKPHFLFNVIPAVNALYRTKPELATTVMENLAVYFKYAVNSDLETVQISEELRVVRAFLEIQCVRMGERLQLELRCDYTTDVEIPFCAVQTLVENAVIHGLRDCEEHGKIIVIVCEQQKNLCVSVQDNGAGIADVENLRVLLGGTGMEVRAPEKRSIGLWNVNRRLKLLGSDGLHIDSVRGEGTIVWFELPITGLRTISGS